MARYDKDEPLSVSKWVGTLILMAIPVLNLVLVFVWAFGNGNQCRKNFAIANLVLVLIGTLGLIAFMAFNEAAFTAIFKDIQSLMPK